MSETQTHKSRLLPLSGVFFLSGVSALLYQVAWQRSLTLYYGVGAVSTTVIVSVYMLGLGSGALIGGYVAPRVRNHIWLYAGIEAAIGAYAWGSLPGLALLGELTAGSSYDLSVLYIASFLFVPTLLMGTTLPLLTKIFNKELKKFLTTVSTLYFLNTLGSALGAALGAYVFISFFGLATTVRIGATMNLAMASFLLIRYRKANRFMAEPEKPPPATGSSQRFVYALVFVTGFLAIGYEIVWFRVIEVLTKNSPYVFASVLTVYLLGIALGSRSLQKRAVALPRHQLRNLFFLFQAAIALYSLVVFSAFTILSDHPPLETLITWSFGTHPHPAIQVLFSPPNGLSAWLRAAFISFDIFLWPLLFMGVPTLLMGATFPLVSSLALVDERRDAQTVGAVYFVNILGNVAGGVVTGFVLLRFLGTELTLLTFIGIGFSFVLLVKALGSIRLTYSLRWIAWGVLGGLGLLLFPGRYELYRATHPDPSAGHKVVFAEGVDAVVATYSGDGSIRHYINGLPHGVRPAPGSYFEVFETAAASEFRKVLMIGFGAGTFLEAALRIPQLRRLTLVELSHTSIQSLRRLPELDAILSHPKVQLILDDGRRHLQRSDQRFDAILMDPLHPQTAYSNNLYSSEFLILTKNRLKPNGILLVYTGGNAIVARTTLDAFPYVRFYRRFCLASSKPIRLDRARQAAWLAALEHFHRKEIEARRASYRGNQKGLRELLVNRPVNRDLVPAAEYFLGSFSAARW